MNFFTQTIIITLVILSDSPVVQGQEYINPAKNLSLSHTPDTLLFKELVTNKIRYKIKVERGSASHYLKFSPSGNYLITSGIGPVTRVYTIQQNTAILTATLPMLTEEIVFNNSEEKIFFLHSKTTFQTKLSSYSTLTWQKIAETNLSIPVRDVSINATGKSLGFSDSTSIRTLNATNLTQEKLYKATANQRLVTFNPAIKNQIVSVNNQNQIQIRDIKKNKILCEIHAHNAKIIWIGYDPTGKLLSSLDKDGYLFTWIPDDKKCIAQLEGVGGKPVFHQDGTLNLSVNNHGKKPGFVKTTRKKGVHGLDYSSYQFLSAN